jgi:hypothetical protein
MKQNGNEIRIALVVVHGIGFQQPFDTLDKLVQHLVATVRDVYGFANVHVTIDELPQAAPAAASTSDFWERNYFEVTARDAAGMAFRFPVFEVYWGHRRDTQLDEAKGRRWAAERLLELDHVGLWRCAERDDPAARNHTALRLLDPDVPADVARVGPGDREVPSWQRRAAAQLIRFADYVPLPRMSAPLIRAAYGFLLGKVRWQDVVGYITADPQNPLYRVRGDILEEVEKRLADVARWATDEANDVDAVVLAGHSLGSVILVDTLNRMRQHPPQRELLAALEPKCGIILFGSPVEHILRLVVLRMRREQAFKNATTIARVAWRLQKSFIDPYRDASIAGLAAAIDDELFTTLPVLNFHAHADPISSEITALRNVTNIPCAYGDEQDPHNAYWEDTDVYARAFTEFLQQGVFKLP